MQNLRSYLTKDGWKADLEETLRHIDIAAGWTAVHIFPKYTTLEFNRFCRWYKNNSYQRFNEGDTIGLISRNIFGYGIRPEGTVVGFEDGRYLIDMERDMSGNWFDWAEKGRVPGTERKRSMERHFKWNIEHHFKKVA